jgi:hypothetical protein
MLTEADNPARLGATYLEIEEGRLMICRACRLGTGAGQERASLARSKADLT